MIRWKTLTFGAAMFIAAHGVLVAGWHEWFQPVGDYPPWFLNAGRGLAFTAAWLFVAGVLVGLGTRRVARESMISGGNLAAGAVVAMCVVLGWVGPGTLFPIALTIGAGVAVVSCVAGAFAGSAFRAR